MFREWGDNLITIILPLGKCVVVDIEGPDFSSNVFINPFEYAPILTLVSKDEMAFLNTGMAAVITSGLLQLKRSPSTFPLGVR